GGRNDRQCVRQTKRSSVRRSTNPNRRKAKFMTDTAAPAAQETPAAAPVKQTFVFGTGRRKTSVARVRIAIGTGKIEINGRELNDYFNRERDRKAIFGP